MNYRITILAAVFLADSRVRNPPRLQCDRLGPGTMYPLPHESEMLRLQAVQSGAHFVHFTLGREDFPIELLRRDLVAHPGKSGPSLVDCMSMEVIRRRRIEDVFA